MGLSPARHVLRAPAADQVALALRALSGQTADLFQIIRSDSGIELRVRNADQEAGLVHVAATFPNAPADFFAGLRSQLVAKGTRTVSNRTMGVSAEVTDHPDVVNRTVNGAANNGAGLIRITTAVAHGWATGDLIAVYGVGGTVEANGWWAITVIDATHFDLQGSAFANAYTAGGTATNRPMLTGVRVVVAPALARGGLTGSAAAADDADGVTVANNGAGKATEAFYATAGGGASPAWFSTFTADADADYAFLAGARAFGVGLDLRQGAFSTAPIRLPNNAGIAALTAAGATQQLLKLNASDLIELLASIQGVPFPATQVPDAGANVLDDYEEGIWTPVLTFATPGDLNVAYTSQAGRYTKIGRLVHASLLIVTSTFTHTTAGGNLRVTGLPFAVNGVVSARGAGVLAGYTKANYTQVSMSPTAGQSYCEFSAGGSGQAFAQLAVADMPTGGLVGVRFSVDYTV
jgi:hypothetical protein